MSIEGNWSQKNKLKWRSCACTINSILIRSSGLKTLSMGSISSPIEFNKGVYENFKYGVKIQYIYIFLLKKEEAINRRRVSKIWVLKSQTHFKIGISIKRKRLTRRKKMYRFFNIFSYCRTISLSICHHHARAIEHAALGHDLWHG